MLQHCDYGVKAWVYIQCLELLLLFMVSWCKCSDALVAAVGILCNIKEVRQEDQNDTFWLSMFRFGVMTAFTLSLPKSVRGIQATAVCPHAAVLSVRAAQSVLSDTSVLSPSQITFALLPDLKMVLVLVFGFSCTNRKNFLCSPMVWLLGFSM